MERTGYLPATALGNPSNTFKAPETISGQAPFNGSGIVECSISIKALKATMVSLLSYTLGRPFSALMAVNHRSRNVRAIPGL